MYTIEESIIAVFCCVDDWLKLKALSAEHPVRSKGFAPVLSDSKVMTMEIVAEYQGIDADRAIWQYFRRHWWAWFPGLGSRSAFVRQAANLWQYKALLQQHIAEQLGVYEDDVHLVDGIPIPLCQFSRAPGCRSFRGEADYGYCADKPQTA